MRHGKKPEYILELEKPDEPTQGEKLHAAQTVSECIAPLQTIATREGLQLSNPKDFKYAVQILRNPK